MTNKEALVLMYDKKCKTEATLQYVKQIWPESETISIYEEDIKLYEFIVEVLKKQKDEQETQTQVSESTGESSTNPDPQGQEDLGAKGTSDSESCPEATL